MSDFPKPPKEFRPLPHSAKLAGARHGHLVEKLRSKRETLSSLTAIALLLSGWLVWGLWPWEAEDSGLPMVQGTPSQSLRPAVNPDRARSTFTGMTNDLGERPEDDGLDRSQAQMNAPVSVGTPVAAGSQIATVLSREPGLELPSAQRKAAILEELTGSTPGSPAALEPARAQALRPKSRSAARSIALADLSERLPAAYFNKDSQTARKAGPPPAAEPGGQGDEDTVVARQSPTGLRSSTAPSPGYPVTRPRPEDSISVSISMLVYSEKAEQRWAKVNGSRLVEGQEVSTGLKVETITPEGIIFDYQGHAFFRAVKAE